MRESKSSSTAPVSSPNGGNAESSSSSDEFRQVTEGVRLAQPLPLGWGHGASLHGKIVSWPDGLLKLLGLLMSSFAVLMGAPFWFDLLNNVMNLRMSGDPPAPSR